MARRRREHPSSTKGGITPEDATPPPVQPVNAGAPRPLWSVMIPTYNCAKYLPETLRSVLEQDQGPEHMQIEVIDDASADRPEDVVRSFGVGRAEYFRQPVNRGAGANFNTCVNRSRGELVHILHGDDVVRPGFYDHVTQLARQWPTAALLATRVFRIDEAGVLLNMTPRLPKFERLTHEPGSFLYENLLQFAGVVIRRSFYEAHGGFIPSLVHTGDWEMWLRAITLGGGVVSPEPLACYRIFEGNDSSRLRLTGENVRDSMRFARLIAARIPGFDAERFRADRARTALKQAEFFHERGEYGAARANQDLWRELTSLSAVLREAPRKLLNAFVDVRRKLRF